MIMWYLKKLVHLVIKSSFALNCGGKKTSPHGHNLFSFVLSCGGNRWQGMKLVHLIIKSSFVLNCGGKKTSPRGHKV